MTRTRLQRAKDFVFFPLRAVAVFENDKWGLSSLRNERFEYCASEVRGYCLDVGCGRGNVFVSRFLGGNGIGIDVYPYDGLGPENIVEDAAYLPFDDGAFATVTFIANLNHIPRFKRDAELIEAFRCLRPGGNIIVTMGAPLAELLAHLAVGLHDRLFGTTHDVDMERGMDPEEEYFVVRKEIIERLVRVGFTDIKLKRFWTQWGLNAMYIGWKPIRSLA